jgi:Gamma tubulin complex component C-terminal
MTVSNDCCNAFVSLILFSFLPLNEFGILKTLWACLRNSEFGKFADLGVLGAGIHGATSTGLVFSSTGDGKVHSVRLSPALAHFFPNFFLSRYKQIFRFLLRMKRLNNAFCDLWSALRDAAIAKRLTQLDHQDMFYWQYMFTHVIAAVQGYIQVGREF